MKAFPCKKVDSKGYMIGEELGMDLRDYFAAKAMVSIQQTIAEMGEDFNPKIVAEDAYILADAMIKEREKTNG